MQEPCRKENGDTKYNQRLDSLRTHSMPTTQKGGRQATHHDELKTVVGGV